MPTVFGCGSNLFGQLLDGQDDVLDICELTQLTSGEPVQDVVAASDSQLLFKSSNGLRVKGFANGLDAEPLVILNTLDTCDIKRVLGKDVLTAALTNEGKILELAGKKRVTSEIYLDAAMDSHGRILALSAGLCELQLFDSLDDLFSEASKPVSLQRKSTKSTKIYAGAAHFIIHVASDIVYGLGDNRHFQQGHEGRSSWTSTVQIPFFEGGSAVKKIACGDLHTAVLTEDGALYMMGSDAKGQCGGFSEREPALVELGLDEGTEEQPDVLDIACGSNHTVILTTQGSYATGSNHIGQLGLGHTTHIMEFTKVSAASCRSPVKSILAAGWNTYFISEE